MFEVGKLSDESLDSLLLELEKVKNWNVQMWYVQWVAYNFEQKKVGVLPIRIVKSNASNVGPSSCFSLTKGQRSKR